MYTRPYIVHALSPLHVGTGHNIGTIDLPIARMRATGIPLVPGSSIKGTLRAATASRGFDSSDARETHAAVFGPMREISGPAGDVALDHAGALIASDARLVALPVRSLRGAFALVTSPLLLELAARDLGKSVDAPEVPVVPTRAALVSERNLVLYQERLILEELDFSATTNHSVDAWAKLITCSMPKAERGMLRQRLAVVDDDTMAFLWETATQIDTRIRIDHETGTVADGALWIEESLPPETLLIGVLAARASMRNSCRHSAKELLDWTFKRMPPFIQFGGKLTIGRGRCRLMAISRRHRRR